MLSGVLSAKTPPNESSSEAKMTKSTKAGHSRGAHKFRAIRQGLPSVSGELLSIRAYPKALLEVGEYEKSACEVVGKKKRYVRWDERQLLKMGERGRRTGSIWR